MMIEKQIGRTLAGAQKKSQEATFVAAEAITLVLLAGFAVIGGFVLLIMIAII